MSNKKKMLVMGSNFRNPHCRSSLKLENDERLRAFVKEEEHTVMPEDLQKVSCDLSPVKLPRRTEVAFDLPLICEIRDKCILPLVGWPAMP